MSKVFLSIVILFASIGALLVYQGTRGTRSLVFTPSELLANAKSGHLARVRVGGKVAEPIKYRVEPDFELTFFVHDPGAPTPLVPVVYHDIKPDMFTAGRDVIIDGDLESGQLKAMKLLTQCPSKYEPPDPVTGQRPSTAEKK